jgi:rhodanese-related sulfurtransferase
MLRSRAGALGLLLVSGAVAVFAQEAPMHTKDSLDTVKESLKAGKAVLLDVREQQEWDAGHLKAARLVPLSKLQMPSTLQGVLKALPKDKVIYTHCRSGNRVLSFAAVLKKHGYDVRPLKTGYDGLVEAGFEKAENKKE